MKHLFILGKIQPQAKEKELQKLSNLKKKLKIGWLKKGKKRDWGFRLIQIIQ